jgi:hypothetical protein
MALSDEQKTLTAEPVVTLTIGSTSLDAFVWGYRYEEKAQDQGGLTIWLDNRGDEFDDLANDYPDIVRGAAIDLRRGMDVAGTPTTEKLPRTWIEGLSYRYIDGAALLEIQCIDWHERLSKFRYSSQQTWSSTEIATIAAAVLAQVNLTLASGTFTFSTDFVISPRRNAEQAMVDLMRRVDEYLYAGLDGEIKHRELDPDEASGYTYDWSAGGGSNHPLLQGSEVAETSPKFTKVTVNGGPALEYTGSAEDSDETALLGTRLRTITDRDLSSNAQCTERARAELRFWQAQTVRGRIVARPHFTLAMYDVLTISAPPWGGPAAVGRVRRIVEEYGRGASLWQQTIDIGGLSGRTLQPAEIGDGTIGSDQIDEDAITEDEVAAGAIVAAGIADGSIVTAKLANLAVETAKIAADAVDGTKIVADAISASHIATDAVTADSILAGEVGADEIAANAIIAVKIAASAVEAGKIATNAVTAGTIAANAVTTDKIDADAVTAAKIDALAVDTEHLAAGAVEAAKINVTTLSAITADMGTLTAGTIKMGTGTKDVDLDGFQIDSSELVGQENGVDQVVLSSSDGKITAGAGAVVLSAEGIHCVSGNADVNKHKVKHGTKTIFAMYGERDEGVGSTNTLEGVGIDGDDPEGHVEIIAITHDGTVHSGVASISIALETENGKITIGGASRIVMGTTYFEMTEQAADPVAPGANRGRLYLKDNGAGKTQLCIRFNTGAVQVVATEP